VETLDLPAVYGRYDPLVGDRLAAFDELGATVRLTIALVHIQSYVGGVVKSHFRTVVTEADAPCGERKPGTQEH